MLRGKGTRSLLLTSVIICSVSFTIFGINDADAGGSSIKVLFNEYWMEQEIPENGVVSSPLCIHWKAENEENEPLYIDMFYWRSGMDSWELMASNLENTGEWTWDMHDPFIPDGSAYHLKILAHSGSGAMSFAISDFNFTVKNLHSPSVEIRTPLDDVELSGELMLQWDVSDDDSPSHLISVKIFLKLGIDGNYSLVYSNIEDPGRCTIDLNEFPNTARCWFLIRAKDESSRMGQVESPCFSIFNNNPPNVEFKYPLDGDSVIGDILIEWNAEDPDGDQEPIWVDLYCKPEGTAAWIALVDNKLNQKNFLLRSSEIPSAHDGLLLRVDVFDRSGEGSGEEIIKIWTYSPGKGVFYDIESPSNVNGTSIDLKWKTNRAVLEGQKDHLMFVRHRMNDEDWKEIQVTDLMMDNLSYPVSLQDDGHHYFQIEYRDNEDNRIMEKREIGPIDVYHGHAPLVHERSIPIEGMFLKGSVYFNLTSIDRNQDLVRFIGYCRLDGCPWTIFDRSLGERNVDLEWNTTYYRPGRYEVKLVAYDGSRLNLTTTVVKGPYYISSSIYTGKYYFMEDDGSTDEGSGSKDGIIWILLIIFLVVLIVSISLIIRKKRRERREFEDKKRTDRIIEKQRDLTEYLKYSPQGLPQYGDSSYYMNRDKDALSKGTMVEDSEYQDPILEMGEISSRMDLNEEDLSSYEILGVPMTANDDMINSVYLKYVRRFHPDRFQDPNPHLNRMINENIRKKNRARRVLLDPAMRAIIDERLREDEGELLRSGSTKSIEQLRELMKKGP